MWEELEVRVTGGDGTTCFALPLVPRPPNNITFIRCSSCHKNAAHVISQPLVKPLGMTIHQPAIRHGIHFMPE